MQMYGSIRIFDYKTKEYKKLIKAHSHLIQLMKLNAKGTICATASKGTLIRVWMIPSGQLLHEFRRGKTPAKIHSVG